MHDWHVERVIAEKTDRIRNLSQIADDDTGRQWLKVDITRLKRRDII